MITKTFICDDCKASKAEEDLFTLNLSIEKSEKSSRYLKCGSCKRDVCKDCLKKHGILTEADPNDIAAKKEEQAANEKKCSVENKLVELLEYLGVAFTE